VKIKMSLLSLSSLKAYYGESQALFDVNLEINEGEIIALMGRNGTGKSTTVKSIFQMIPTKGELLFSGENLNNLKSFQISRLGVGLVPEGRRVFGQLSVRENLIAASREGEWSLEEINNLFPKLRERSSQVASSLSGGEQQMLAIARALMTNPRLLVLDEATEGLAPIIRQEIWSAIKTLKNDTGLAILIIDKSIKELRQICDRVVILEKGSTVWQGKIDQLSSKITQEFIGV
jgi:branched-chain amino acid transport system ATP-binding protein